jgi:hypothetical protein
MERLWQLAPKGDSSATGIEVTGRRAVMDAHAGSARMKGETRQATDKARDAFKR